QRTERSACQRRNFFGRCRLEFEISPLAYGIARAFPPRRMDAHLFDFLSLLLRWLHVIAGIAWIGSSFYFIWLDNSLEPPASGSENARKGVAGELWAVHGGGFYNPQKYAVAPASLPEKLHWFKWEAYTTWLSGTAL